MKMLNKNTKKIQNIKTCVLIERKFKGSSLIKITAHLLKDEKTVIRFLKILENPRIDIRE